MGIERNGTGGKFKFLNGAGETLFEQFGKDLGPELFGQLEKLLAAGQVVFLFDSMDEMPRADYGASFEVLKRFADKHSNNNSCKTIRSN